MIVNLKTSASKWNEKEKKIVTEYGELPVEIDVSIAAHLKWEEQFQDTLHCSLVEYHDLAASWLRKKENAKANYLGLLKLLFCFINSDRLPSFKDFCRLFSPETFEDNFKVLMTVFEEIGKTASKN